MTRETDVQVLDDYREVLRHVRRVLDDLARSDARNTAEINGLRRDLDRLEKRLDNRHGEMVTWVGKVETKADGNQQHRWRFVGGKTALVTAVSLLAAGGAIATAILKLL